MFLYSHRPFYCPHCGFYDTQQDLGTVINREDLPVEFFKNGQQYVHGFTLTIKCPTCKKVYKADERYVLKVLDERKKAELKIRIEECEEEMSVLEMQIDEYRDELLSLQEGVAPGIPVV